MESQSLSRVAGGVRHLPARAGVQRAVRAGGRVRRGLRSGGRLSALPLPGAAGDAADHTATTATAAAAPAAATTTRAAALGAAAGRARAGHLDVHAVSRWPWQWGAQGGAQQVGGPRGLRAGSPARGSQAGAMAPCHEQTHVT